MLSESLINAQYAERYNYQTIEVLSDKKTWKDRQMRKIGTCISQNNTSMTHEIEHKVTPRYLDNESAPLLIFVNRGRINFLVEMRTVVVDVG